MSGIQTDDPTETKNATLNPSPIMKQDVWDKFAKGDLMNFMALHNLQKIVVEDGAGKKASIKINKNGEYQVQVTFYEVM